jgi:hypothetical protein
MRLLGGGLLESRPVLSVCRVRGMRMCGWIAEPFLTKNANAVQAVRLHFIFTSLFHCLVHCCRQ